MISVAAMDKLKSTVVNSIIKDNPKVRELQHIERELLLPKLRECYTNTTAQMYNLIGILPKDKGWQYNRPKMKKYQPEIDRVVKNVINSNAQLKEMLLNSENSLLHYLKPDTEYCSANKQPHSFITESKAELAEEKRKAQINGAYK